MTSLPESLTQAVDVARANRGQLRSLQWIVAALLLVVLIFAGSVFAMIVRNNLVILPDRTPTRQPAPALPAPAEPAQKPFLGFPRTAMAAGFWGLLSPAPLGVAAPGTALHV
jgi:hypothetical protein